MTKSRTITGICSTPTRDSHGQIANTAGYSWKTPLPLLVAHRGAPVGTVTRIWRDGEAIRFRANVTDDAIWNAIESGDMRAASIEMKRTKSEHDDAGILIVKEGEIAEVSICQAGANPDAVFEISARKSVKLKPVSTTPVAAPDPIADEMQGVRARMKAVDAHIANALDACHRHQGFDNAKWMAADSLLKKLNVERVQLLQREMEIEAGVAVAPQRVARRAPSWDIEKDIELPAYPEQARRDGDSDALLAAQEAYIRFWINESLKSAAETESSPHVKADLGLIYMLNGRVNGLTAWQSDRTKALEQRVAELEANATFFAGPHNRALPYKKGALCVHGGGLWAAISDVPVGATPGQSDLWMLAVKRGDVT